MIVIVVVLVVMVMVMFGHAPTMSKGAAFVPSSAP
jgi:hypothetical protein